MRYIYISFLLIVLSISACRKDFNTIPSSGKLEFSKTTVYLDTVFSSVGSSTYMLKVYNRSNNDITIPSIALAKGEASKYRLMVDGMTGIDGSDSNTIGDGKIFPNVTLLANDSLFVFIETTIDIASANPADMLYTDEILFDSGALQQKVNLVTLVQDAIFLYPEKYTDGTYESIQIGSDPTNRIYGFFLDDTELTFTNAKPYVIYGYAAVAPGKTLTVNAGARVHFHDQSGIIVGNTGSIQVNGTPSLTAQLENEVIFEGDRLEPLFSEVPGQWGTILLTNGSVNNIFTNLTIKNASVGIFIQGQEASSTVQIKNTQIYNSANVGILARNSKINGENIVINNAGQYALACTLGGSYDFNFCTFTNYWTSGNRQSPAVLVDNTFYDGNTLFVADLVQANFKNSIIYGSNNIEIGFNKNSGANFNSQFNNCLIKFNDTNNQFGNNSLYTSLGTPSFQNLISNATVYDPKFKNYSKNQLNIMPGSAAIQKGLESASPLPNDILNMPRPTSPNRPDIGAYQAP
jgi:hypothetical protein